MFNLAKVRSFDYLRDQLIWKLCILVSLSSPVSFSAWNISTDEKNSTGWKLRQYEFRKCITLSHELSTTQTRPIIFWRKSLRLAKEHHIASQLCCHQYKSLMETYVHSQIVDPDQTKVKKRHTKWLWVVILLLSSRGNSQLVLFM